MRELSADRCLLGLQLEHGELMSSLREKVEMVTAIAPAQQQLLLNGQPIRASGDKPCDSVLTEGVLLYVLPLPPPAAISLAFGPDGAAVNPEVCFCPVMSQKSAVTVSAFTCTSEELLSAFSWCVQPPSLLPPLC
jgi:hypothetical protein